VARSLGPGKTSQARRALSRLDTLIGASLAGESTVLVRAERDAR
jgi:hypothetical protein